MKKLFSLLAAVLFAGSMMAENATMAKGTTNSYDDVTVNGGSAIKMGKSGAGGNMTITVGAGATYLAFYAGGWNNEPGTVTIEAPTGVTVDGEASTTLNVSANSAFSGTGKSFTVASPEDYAFSVALTGTESGATFTLNSSKRCIVWGATFGTGDVPVIVVEYDTLNVAQAIDSANVLADNATSRKFYIEGYAVNVGAYSTTYNNQDFYLVDDVNAPDSILQVFRATPTKDGQAYPVLAGDQLRIFGALKKYVKDNKTQLEIVESTIEFVTEAEGDRTIDVPEVDTITIARALVIGDSIGQGNTTEGQYVIEGYVTALTDSKGVANLDGGWAQYGNQCMWLADSFDVAATTKTTAFFVYQAKASEQITKGAKIRFTSAIKNYNGMIENAIYPLTVTILEKGEDPVVPADPDTLNVAQATEEALKLDNNATSLEKYVVQGYIAKFAKDGEYSSTYKNASFYMTDEVGSTYGDLKCYRASVAPADSALCVAGAYVMVEGNLQNNFYNNKNTAQLVNGKVTFIPAPTIDTIPATVAEAIAIGNALEDNAKTEEYYLVTGYVVNPSEMEEEETTQDFYLADEKDAANASFKAFRAKIEYPGVTEGDKVALFGKIKKNVYGDITTIQIEQGTVTVIEAQGIENVVLTEKAQKVVVDGVIYIIRDNKLFNLQGAQVR